MSSPVTTALSTSLRATWKHLRQAAASDGFAAELADIFAASDAAAEHLRQRILSGSELGLCFEVLYPDELNGSLGGYRASGSAGTATMDVSAELLADSAHAGTLRRMLLEAIGHHIEVLLHGDAALAGEAAPTGDGVQRFASLLQGDARSAHERATLVAEEIEARPALAEQPAASGPRDSEIQRDLRAFAALVPTDPELKDRLRSCAHPDEILQLAYHKGFVLCSTELREESSNLAAPHWPWSGKGSRQRHRFFQAA